MQKTSLMNKTAELTCQPVLEQDPGDVADAGAVPATVAELKGALLGGDLNALADADDDVRPTATDVALPRRQTRDLVADDAGAEGDHGRSGSVGKQKRQCCSYCENLKPSH